MSQWYYGKDGQQQGPVDAETIKGLLASGQLGPNDLAWKEGMANWAAINTISELAGDVGAASQHPAAPAAPANPYGQSQQYGQPGGYQQPGAYQGPVAYQPNMGDPSLQGKATTAMILGILSIVTSCFVCGPIGIGLGIPAMIMGGKAMAAPNQGQAKAGKTCGIIGLIIGILTTVLSIIYIIGMIAAGASGAAGAGGGFGVGD
jgi:hypothetical protein